MYTLKDGNPLPISSIYALKDAVARKIVSIYTIVEGQARLVWTAVKDFISNCFSGGYWINEERWTNEDSWKNSI